MKRRHDAPDMERVTRDLKANGDYFTPRSKREALDFSVVNDEHYTTREESKALAFGVASVIGFGAGAYLVGIGLAYLIEAARMVLS
jgi:hypothetical protein